MNGLDIALSHGPPIDAQTVCDQPFLQSFGVGYCIRICTGTYGVTVYQGKRN